MRPEECRVMIKQKKQGKKRLDVPEFWNGQTFSHQSKE